MLQPYNKRVPCLYSLLQQNHCNHNTFTFTLLPALWSRLNRLLKERSILSTHHLVQWLNKLSLLWRARKHVSDLNDLQVCASGKIRALFLVCVLKRTHTTSLKCKCEVVAYCINLPDSNKSSSCDRNHSWGGGRDTVTTFYFISSAHRFINWAECIFTVSSFCFKII